jgi:hypothetical protein
MFAVQALFTANNWDQLETGGYVGPDSYMRMLRVEKLFDGAGWYDRASERTNAPYGEMLPWGRPLDAVLVGLTAAIAPFTDLRTAIYGAGLAIGPLITLLMIPLWSWGTRPFIGGGTYLMIFVLTPFATFVMLNLQIGRPDHHGFLALMFMAQLCTAFRLATGNGGGRTAFLMGLAGGVMVWASIMGLIAQIAFSLVLALRFLRNGGAGAREIFLYGAGLVLIFTIAVPLESPPSGLLTVSVEKLSVVQWTLAAVAALTWWGIGRYFQRHPDPTVRTRVGALLLGAAVPLGLMAVLFPDFFLGPTASYDPEAVAFFFVWVAELQPLVPTGMATLSKLVIYLGPVFIALGYIANDYRKAPVDRRAVYDVVLVGFLVYIPMALMARRFAMYAQVLALVPWALALAAIMGWTRTVKMGLGQVLVRGLSVMAAMIGPLVLSVAVDRLATPPRPDSTIQEWVAIGDFLTTYAGATGGGRDAPEILFTYQLQGPEMAWRTPYSVVGAPYGNIDSIRDTYAIFDARTDADARRVIERRGIDLVLYCQAERDNAYYRVEAAGSLLSRIEADRVPDWLEPIALPGDLAARFKLYRVRRDAAKHSGTTSA